MPGRAQAEYVLFVRDRDPARETWDGQARRARRRGARLRRRRCVPDRRHRRHPARPDRELRARLLHDGRAPGVRPARDRLGQRPARRSRSTACTRRRSSSRSITCCTTCGCSRVAPSSTVMRRAAQIAVGAHMRAMRAARPGVIEYEVMAELLHEFHRHNADISYHPIVGGGANACVLHYRENNADARGRRPAADRRRLRVRATTPPTSPARSRSTAASRRSSARSTRSCSRRRTRRSRRCRPGNHWNEPHDAAVRAITQGLVRLGSAQGPACRR